MESTEMTVDKSAAPASSSAVTVISRDPPASMAGRARDSYQVQRSALFQTIGSGGEIATAVAKLQSGITYRLVAPKGEILQAGADGRLSGVFRKNGQIKEHAKFGAISPSVMELAKVLGTQCILAQISLQLSEINGKIDQLLQKGRNDRLGEVLGCVDAYNSAIHGDEEFVKSRLNGAILHLRIGIRKCIFDLKNDIAKLPDVPETWWQSLRRQILPWSSIEKEADSHVMPILELASAIKIGAECLAACYFQLGEIDLAKGAISKNAQNIEDCNPDKLASFLRQLPMAREQAVWAPFEGIRRAKADLVAIDSGHQSVIHLEFQKEDILL